MVYFGPAGTSDEVIDGKMTKAEHCDYLLKMGVTAYEYPLTYGVNMTDATKKEVVEHYARHFKLSVHAPYYINFASPNEEQILKSFSHLMGAVKRAKEIGADRVVFHPGALTGQTREVAQNNCINALKRFLELLDNSGITGVYICPETMGKHGQLGTVDEVYEMCALDERIIPTIDFGHINAFTLGGLDAPQKYSEILDKFVNKLGKKEIHIHFSRIEFTPKGEKRHLTLSEQGEFGPDYKDFLIALKKFDGANIRVISESSGTQSVDSAFLQEYYKKVF